MEYSYIIQNIITNYYKNDPVIHENYMSVLLSFFRFTLFYFLFVLLLILEVIVGQIVVTNFLYHCCI